MNNKGGNEYIIAHRARWTGNENNRQGNSNVGRQKFTIRTTEQQEAHYERIGEI